MLRIQPFEGYYVNPARTADVVSPPYDALTPAQRHAFATVNPRNYLNVMRSLEEFPEDQRPDIDELLAGNRARLNDLIVDGELVHHPRPSLYLYRLTDGDHVQTGVVSIVPVSSYVSHTIKKHENTQEAKENDLVRYLEVVGASSSPICVAYPAQDEIDETVAELAEAEPILDFDAEDGVRQTVWLIDDPATIHRLVRLFEQVPAGYLTDGHHRAAAGARMAAGGSEEYLLSAFFPDNQLRILEYNRCVSGLNGQSLAQFLGALEQSFAVEWLDVSDAEQARPRAAGEVAMFVQGQWYRLNVHDALRQGDDPVAKLDVSTLQRHLFEPVLGIDDPRNDPRLRYMSAAFSPAELAAMCSAPEDIAFVVYPTSIRDLMAVADAGAAMPPKSTWFDPKLRSGLFLRLR